MGKLAQELKKTQTEILNLPASEFVFWEAFFSIYPFTVDREDQRFAMLASVLSYVSGRTLKQPINESVFIPDYLGERKINTDKTLEQQQAEFKAFHSKLKAQIEQAKGK